MDFKDCLERMYCNIAILVLKSCTGTTGGPINHNLPYFVAKFVCRNLRAFRCKFFLPKSCLCNENDKYQVWIETMFVVSVSLVLVLSLRSVYPTTYSFSRQPLSGDSPTPAYICLYILRLFAIISTSSLSAFFTIPG